MSFNWADYLAVSEQLFLETQQAQATFVEAKYRIAISRAYYAAFGIAYQRLQHEQVILSTGTSVHREVIDHYQKSTDVARNEIGQRLNRLRKLRNFADYEPTITFDLAKSVPKSFVSAKIILQLVANLP